MRNQAYYKTIILSVSIIVVDRYFENKTTIRASLSLALGCVRDVYDIMYVMC